MKKTSFLTLLATTVAGLGIVGTAVFAAGVTPTQTTSQPVQSTAQEIQNKLPDANEKNEKDSEISEAQEQQILQSQAKITPDQAKSAAELKVSGTASNVELEDEDGTIVYKVSIGTQEVKVNATDSSIIKIESADKENDSADNSMTPDNDEKSHQESTVSDGDGETIND